MKISAVVQMEISCWDLRDDKNAESLYVCHPFYLFIERLTVLDNTVNSQFIYFTVGKYISLVESYAGNDYTNEITIFKTFIVYNMKEHKKCFQLRCND